MSPDAPTTVVTDVPLHCATPITESHCDDCTECVAACPEKAIEGALFAMGTARDVLCEAPACRDAARARAAAVGVDATICGICIGVCPCTKRYLGRERRPGRRARLPPT
ncbi:MAG TPA: 4Fe-4S double cluster binding domain-containing protein [Anaeromyxobacteraceae bacterium]|nr:4Fe-4S double cluster binding domain-containing protein [Anaeromyxobacteraceae bacterium]